MKYPILATCNQLQLKCITYYKWNILAYNGNIVSNIYYTIVISY